MSWQALPLNCRILSQPDFTSYLARPRAAGHAIFLPKLTAHLYFQQLLMISTKWAISPSIAVIMLHEQNVLLL